MGGSLYILRNKLGSFYNSFYWFDHFLAGRENLIFEQRAIDVQDKCVAIYATFCEDDWDEWELIMFGVLKAQNFEIVTVNNQKPWVQNSAAFKRKNRGFDLAAVRDVMEMFNGIPSEILVLNSSVAYNHGFSKMISQSRKIASENPSDRIIVGATDSMQSKHHMQSYFFFARGNSVEVLMQVYRKMKNWRFKRSAVFFGEIAILSKLKKMKIKCVALYPYNSLIRYALTQSSLRAETRKKIINNIPQNSTQQLWRELFSFGAPFVKRNLFNKNTGRVSGIPRNLKDALNHIS